MDDILGTSATNVSDLTLLAYVFLLLPGMIIGFFFARRKLFVPYHKFTMTGVTLVNWALIAFVMVVSYSNYIAPYVPDNFSDIRAVIATIHLLSGALAQGLATYLVILMWTERTRFEGILPPALRIRRIKGPMRVTLALWITTVVLGLGIYFTWYVGEDEDPSALAAPGATEQAAPNSTEDANANLALTEDASASLALTEAVVPCPVATEAVDDDDDDNRRDDDDDDNRPVATEPADGLPTPAATESAFPCPAVTESADDNRPRPAFTASVDDDDDNGGSRDDNSGRGSSNSGRDDNDDNNSGSGNSGSGNDNNDDD